MVFTNLYKSITIEFLIFILYSYLRKLYRINYCDLKLFLWYHYVFKSNQYEKIYKLPITIYSIVYGFFVFDK